MKFKLESEYSPTGDQPQAIKQLVEGINDKQFAQTLLGATGTGKTFTVANVIQQVNKPTLILSHNKTLAAQLYSEFKHFFPDNLVEYFVSYYDYYQPEAFIPSTGTFIEKDLSINAEIEKLRLATTSSLLSGRSDVIVVSSVSCIYGIGNPKEFHKSVIKVEVGQQIARNKFLLLLVESLYSRTEMELENGRFRVKGDTVDVFLAYADYAVRIIFWGNEIESIETIDPISGQRIHTFDTYNIYPANLFVTSKDTLNQAISEIQDDMVAQVDYFAKHEKGLEAARLKERVEYDVEMMKELGYCSGIENYSRYFDRRSAGDRPFCLLDYFPDDFLLVVDESHVTMPQIKAMYGGDRSRKVNLVDYGFRLPSAMDNRPLQFPEFESMINQVVYVSATPADYELEQSEGVLIDQVIRPTGLLDPIIDVRPTENQIDDLIAEIHDRSAKKERTLVTTLTKRMAEELDDYLRKLNIKCTYIHSDVETLERIDILQKLRSGEIDVLIGVNLLREGLDLPEVSLVAILDADKEGFLRSARSLTQTSGRAARNINGYVIMYADKVTDSMQRTIDETNRRREKQLKYNADHGLAPKPLIKPINNELSNIYRKSGTQYSERNEVSLAAEPEMEFATPDAVKAKIKDLRKRITRAAELEDFLDAAKLRDQMYALEEKLKTF
jgi:excinuclease ABC subunit B